jgi:DNA-binding CsgD family transcriptional regulator
MSAKHNESDFVEILFDNLIMESFPIESSPYFSDEAGKKRQDNLEQYRGKVLWHINHSLSARQKEVLKLFLLGKKEAEIGQILGIKQQVVNIYKHRAIRKLKDKLRP